MGSLGRVAIVVHGYADCARCDGDCGLATAAEEQGSGIDWAHSDWESNGTSTFAEAAPLDLDGGRE